jgi:3-hydroxybutyryl-CoA dehydratase
MPAVYLDDIQTGATFTTARRTITEADIVAFAGVSGDFNPLHTDEMFVREHTHFDGRIAHGPLIHGLSYGLASVRDDWQILALAECQRRFLAPVYPGDTVWGEYEVVEVRASKSRPLTGFVTLAVTMRSDRSAAVQKGKDVLMVGRRSERRDRVMPRSETRSRGLDSSADRP